MKFVVSVEDFWLEEDEGTELSSALREAVKNDVISQIRASIKEQVSVFMDSHIKSVLNAEIETRVKIVMDEIVSRGKIKGNYSSDPELTVSEWASKKFADARPDITKSIESQVKRHVTELQQRYDLLFASQLISKMKEAGFMKEDVEKLLQVSKTNELPT